MTVAVKTCGLSTPESVACAVDGGAAFVGFVFYPPSPRAVTIDTAAALAAEVPEAVKQVGLFVDADDGLLEAVLDIVPLDMLQLHGAESPDRVADIRRRFGQTVMKAVKVAAAADVEAAQAYEEAADWLLFDAKAPKTMAGALPGGNALSFDWQLLAGRAWKRPWMLAGGLNADNVGEAVAATGAVAVDVSSGIEDRPGHKDPARIRAFLAAVAKL